MFTDFTTAHFIVLLLGIVLGSFITVIVFSKKTNQAKNEAAILKAQLELEQQASEKLKASEQALLNGLKDSFSALSSEALKSNNEAFLQLAKENLKQHQGVAENSLNEKQLAFNDLVKPIKQMLEKTDQQLAKLEADRRESFGSISQYLQNMTQTQQALQSETSKLVQALKRPEVRGQWGELTLKRLAELAGLVEHCDFTEQTHVKTDEQAIRPDMVIRMPDQREVVVDAKTPLDAFLMATEATNDTERKTHLERHAKQVRDRVKELSKKSYWSQFENAPDFVVLFIPGDQFLSAALEFDHTLLEDALAQQVILATPTSLVALLRAIAFGWRQQASTENAEKIRQLGEQLYGRIATFVEHLSKTGSAIEKSVDHYNKAIGSLERQVLPSARRFKEMGIESRKEVDNPEPIEKNTRQPNQIDLKQDD